MSTAYRPLKDVLACELFDGRLQKFGVREHVNEDTSEERRCLTDGNNFLWLYINDGLVSSLTRYAPNGAPGKILNAIAQAFDTDIVSEHEPQFYGFADQAEWDAFEKELGKKHDEEFCVELLKYLAGEPNDIRPGTIGEGYAKKAKKLVTDNPTLVEKPAELLEAARVVYMRDEATIVHLTPEDIAAAEMHATHEDDLPQA